MENIISYKHKRPKIESGAYINPYAIVIGDVTIHTGVSLWPGVILRADDDHVEIGRAAAILDRSFIEAPRGYPVDIGENVLVSHGVTLHGSQVKKDVLIGISANILDGAKIGEESVISAGTLVPPNTTIPPRSKVMGVPAKVIGKVTDTELSEMRLKHAEIIEKAREYGKWFVANNI